VAQAQIGMEAKITESISAFAEYKFDYSWNSVDLNGGGTLDANIGTSQPALLPRHATIPA